MTEWIADLHGADKRGQTAMDSSSLLLDPLRTLRDAHSTSEELVDIVAATLEVVESLGSHTVPSAFEHGDWAAPNLLVSPAGDLGVVDWELAEPAGLPGVDLFFGLTYLALAADRATTIEAQLAASRSAFIGQSAWAAPFIGQYAARAGLDPEVLPALFVATWARQFLGLLARLPGDQAQHCTRLRSDRWLKSNRAFALWKHALRHAGNFRLWPRPLQIGVL